MGELHSGFRIPCNSCSDIFLTIGSLKDHETEMHKFSSLLGENHRFKCEYCEEAFQGKKDMMINIKSEHIENVKLCKYFIEDSCVFGVECWLLHDLTKKLETRPPTQLKCMFCESSFDSKHKLMNHRKKEHPKRVKQCRNDLNGNCQYGPILCWYNHTKKHEKEAHINIQVDKHTTNNDMEKLVKMIQSFDQRLLTIEGERNMMICN